MTFNGAALLLALLLSAAVFLTVTVQTLQQLPEELKPPIDVDWSCESGSARGFINASPISNTASILWSRGGAGGLGFGVEVRRSSLTPMPPLICEGLIVLTDNENVYALNLEDGNVEWGISIYWEPDDPKPWYVSGGLGLELFVHSMASEGGKLYIATSPSIYDEKSRIICLDLKEPPQHLVPPSLLEPLRSNSR